jgi:chorismate-pyruvate lyase
LPVNGIIYRVLNSECISPENIYQLEGKSGIKINNIHKLLLLDTGNTQLVLESILNVKNYVRVLKQNESRNLIVRRSMILSVYDEPLVLTRSILYTKMLPSLIIQEIRRCEIGLGKIAQTHGIVTSKKVIEIGCMNRVIYKKYLFLFGENKVGNIKETFVLNLEKFESN